MKYVIEIFENGVRTDVLVTDIEYDWDGYYKVFHDKNNSYVIKGYRTVECKRSSISECQYIVLFNDNEMKSAVISAKFRTESDFVDADGQPIILSKLSTVLKKAVTDIPLTNLLRLVNVYYI